MSSSEEYFIGIKLRNGSLISIFKTLTYDELQQYLDDIETNGISLHSENGSSRIYIKPEDIFRINTRELNSLSLCNETD